MGNRRGYMSIDYDGNVDIDVYDVIAFIEQEAKPSDLKKIKELVFTKSGSILDELKWDLVIKSMDEFSLEELEKRLGK